MNTVISRFLLIVLIALSIGGWATNSIQPLAPLSKAAKTFLEEQFAANRESVEIKIGKIDPRLRLTACDQTLKGFAPASSRLKGNTVIGVRCSGSSPWHIFIPVSIKITEQVVFFTRTLSKDDVITAKDIELRPIDISSLRVTPLTEATALIGAVVKQKVTAGQVAHERLACMVCKGKSLTLVSGNQTFSVSMTATALEDGFFGSAVRVKNAQSKRIVNATVVAANRARVNL